MDYITNPYGDFSYTANNPQRITPEKAEEYTMEDFGLTVNWVKAQHFGIKVYDENRNELPDQFYEYALRSAIVRVEQQLDIAILPRHIPDERQDFTRAEYENYNFIHTYKKPILQLENLRLEYPGGSRYNYPPEWWKVYTLPGHIQIMPQLFLNSQGTSMNQLMHTTYPMIAGLPQQAKHRNSAPQLLNVNYIAGLLPPKRPGVVEEYEMPPNLNQLILKTAVIEVFEIYGRLIIGPGVGSISNVLDGASQSIDSTQTAMYGGASAEILQINEDIGKLKAELRSYFGFNMGIMGG